MIYHLTLPAYWSRFGPDEAYVSETYDQEGFIHLGTAEQVPGVLRRYYRGVPRLLKLHVDESKLTSELKYEAATGGELFPHLYGPLNREAVAKIEEITQPFSVGLVLFPGLTQLDLTGPYEVLCRLPQVRVHLLAETPDPVPAGDGPLRLVPTVTFADCPPLDLLLVPGGPGVDEGLAHEPLMTFLRKTGQEARYVTSVCTGSLLLAAAGLLDGHRATTHWLSLDLLGQFPGVTVVPDRVVKSENRFTGGGVTAGIDFALALVAELYGAELAQLIQLKIEYNPQPPFASGHPDTAPADVLEIARRSPSAPRRAAAVRRAVLALSAGKS
jgi:cyclohexyl-isocyanide hydratase